ncbi:MAG: Fic family protein [Alphaproteobacteria bacterium]|nr:Fic family protein [Alphaproteobacteria bacterium]
MEKDPFKEYLRQSEPGKRDKSYAWNTAIGLQDVDGLKTSEYLKDTAIKNIEGDITIDEAQTLLNTYYKENNQKNKKDRTEEADKVSLRIAKILSEKAFSFSANEYISIHKKLFDGIYDYAGRFRDYNITKKEWVLDGDTVIYGTATELKATLDYDISQEKKFNYKGLSPQEIIHHLALFISGLWQIHAFGEGNTRTTAVFFIKYLRTLGFDVTNDIFAHNSWYFRNALVRANYTDLTRNIHSTTEYLELFLENLLLGKNHKLLNRMMHISHILDRKVDIEASKVDIRASKVDIEYLCRERLPNITTKSIRHILKIYETCSNTRHFGRSEIIEITNLKPAMASRLLKLLLDNGIIRPIQGKGKGKYIFAIG